MSIQVGELIKMNFEKNTMKFEIEAEMENASGKFALVPLDEYQELIKPKGCSKLCKQ